MENYANENIPIVVEDPLGIDTGIHIINTTFFIDKKNDLVITGDIFSNIKVPLVLEPDLLCLIIAKPPDIGENKSNRIIQTDRSYHTGIFNTQNLTHCILKTKLDDINNIAEIHLKIGYFKEEQNYVQIAKKTISDGARICSSSSMYTK